MSFAKNIFDSEVRDLGNKNYLHIINIEQLDKGLVDLIDRRIVSICEACTSTDLSTIKKRLISFLASKKGTATEMGAIAEFFIHLYLNELGFKQECLFLNLEEGSIKKGFDGYYSRSSETWIIESKSGSRCSKGVSHKSKIKEAHTDLEEKIAGNNKNNPWQNAYNHARIIEVNSGPDIRKQLKKMADDFTNAIFHKIEDFNIIPGSTIFLDGAWSRIDSDTLEKELKALVLKLSFNKIQIVCVNKASVKLFWNYLENQ